MVDNTTIVSLRQSPIEKGMLVLFNMLERSNCFFEILSFDQWLSLCINVYTILDSVWFYELLQSDIELYPYKTVFNAILELTLFLLQVVVGMTKDEIKLTIDLRRNNTNVVCFFVQCCCGLTQAIFATACSLRNSDSRMIP